VFSPQIKLGVLEEEIQIGIHLFARSFRAFSPVLLVFLLSDIGFMGFFIPVSFDTMDN